MAQIEFPLLPDYDEISESLAVAREVYLKSDDHALESQYLRTVAEAKQILKFLQTIQTRLHRVFSEHNSLVQLFEKDFSLFKNFLERRRVLEICFFEDYLFPEEESYPIVIDESLDHETMNSYETIIEEWVTTIVEQHLNSQEVIKEKFSLDLKPNLIPCRCYTCTADYRTKVRGEVFAACLQIIDEAESYVKENINDKELNEISSEFYSYQKEIEKLIHKVRFRLKRSSLSKLEKQIKENLKSKFDFQTEVGQLRINQLKSYFVSYLESEELNENLISEEEYGRFLKQLGITIWRSEKQIRREFSRFVNSVMILKRKDISSTILQEYLGQFWLYAEARQLKRKIIYHLGPTNSGKTYHAIERLAEVEKGCYLAPLRLLAGELYDTLNEKGVKTTLLTGEEVIEMDDATHFSSTIEMAKFHQPFDCAVIDEIQMITDPQRGWAWTRALINIFAPEVHICGDPSVLDLVTQIVELTGDEIEIKRYERMTELIVEDRPIVSGELQKGDALIVFSRRNALKYKADLERMGFKVSIVYGRLSPEVRREQARKFDSGETDIIVSTDAIAMGMNLPIRRIIFSTLSKFIDSKEHPISHAEIKQIAGRAGRYLRFPTGYVTCLKRVEDGIPKIYDAIADELDQREEAMVGPDLEIFSSVNKALTSHDLPILKLPEFLRLFNTMIFKNPFYCVNLKEMIEIAEMVDEANSEFDSLSASEIFGFSCAPVNLGLVEHVQYFVWILNQYVRSNPIKNEEIDYKSSNIDYLETAIKCVEIFQWLSRHFNGKNFDYDEAVLLHNKQLAIEKLNDLLSDKIVRNCSSCGVVLADTFDYNICETCFKSRRFTNRRRDHRGDSRNRNKSKKKSNHNSKSSKNRKKKSNFSNRNSGKNKR